MSNRVLSFLILFVIFGTLIGGYLYLFVYYTGTLVLAGNQDNFSVKFHSDTIKKTIEVKCEKNICEIPKLPPLDLTYTISKEGFKDFVGEVQIPRNGKVNANFILKKQTVLVPENNVEQTATKSKIDELRTLGTIKEKYAYFDMGDLGIYYFEENTDSLALYNSLSGTVTKIYDVPKIDKENLSISLVASLKKQLFIEAGDNKYIYDIDTGNVYNFSLKIPVKYVKTIDLAGNYQIVTEKGVFLYSSKTGNLEYFSMFSDFIYYDDSSYIGVIFSSEDDKKKDYSISGNNNIVLYYNYKTKEKKILMDTSVNISKIVKEGENIYVYDSDNKRYLLKVGE
ncbi:MAG: hypothetical protein PHG82_01490 [Candidatus Gracilibacteria bacterium]|nr:hypothetical protein [Candidatus Gracilibacteria bacterium]